jgi:hypothetical protein
MRHQVFEIQYQRVSDFLVDLMKHRLIQIVLHLHGLFLCQSTNKTIGLGLISIRVLTYVEEMYVDFGIFLG